MGVDLFEEKLAFARTRHTDSDYQRFATRFDTLVSQARREQDETKRVAMYAQADELAFNEAPMIFLYFYNELYAIQPWIKGFVPPVIFNGQNWTTVTKAVSVGK